MLFAVIEVLAAGDIFGRVLVDGRVAVGLPAATAGGGAGAMRSDAGAVRSGVPVAAGAAAKVVTASSTALRARTGRWQRRLWDWTGESASPGPGHSWISLRGLRRIVAGNRAARTSGCRFRVNGSG